MQTSRWRISSRFDHFQEAVNQAQLYIVSFIVPYFILLLATFVSTQNQLIRFVLAFFVKFVLPLAGLSNFIIYIRPRCILLRLDQGESISSYNVLQEIILGRGTVQSANVVNDDFAPELSLDTS
jgi:hypothetical protein